MKPRIAVIVFPGSNDDRDAALALELLGAEPVLVWHAKEELPDVGAVVLPGGFSYGDYLRSGAIARFAPVMEAVASFAANGGLVLGICNGFQILCEAGLLPGVLRPNAGLAFVCRDVELRVCRRDTPFTEQCDHDQRLVIPVKHGDGCYLPPPDLPSEQVVLRYEAGANPNGSVDDIAGIVSEAGNVMGLMPHPEHAVDPLLGSTDGAVILGSLVEAARAARSRWLIDNSSPRGWWLRHVAGWRRPPSPVFPDTRSDGRRPLLGLSHPRIDGNHRPTI